MQINILKKLGFSDKDAKVYLTLLQSGPASVRKLAEMCSLNRGVVYESLKWLGEQKLVNFYEKGSRQHFVAEDPEKLSKLFDIRFEELSGTKELLRSFIPELRSLHSKGGDEPTARYYESGKIHLILKDVLETCSSKDQKMYRIYSTAGIREFIYDNFADFSEQRVKEGIAVKAIAIGKGGELRGLDERKWLNVSNKAPTYILIYPGKTAYISLTAQHEPMGVVIENDGIFEMQKNIFDVLWEQI
jgi:sugar-specific transcriptional regulator TrmB